MFKRLMLLSVFAIMLTLDVIEASDRYSVRGRRLSHEEPAPPAEDSYSYNSYDGYKGYSGYDNKYGGESSYYTGYNDGGYKAAYYDKYYNNYRKGDAHNMVATGLASISALFAIYA